MNDYFKSNDISRHANSEMTIKTIVMFALYFVPYFLIIAGVVTGTAWLVGLTIIMGFGLAGIGLSVMHDANHGAYSKRQWINTTIGYSMNLIGANAFNWKMQHNVLHHSYTNVHGEDEDISPRGCTSSFTSFRVEVHAPVPVYICLVSLRFDDARMDGRK